MNFDKYSIEIKLSIKEIEQEIWNDLCADFDNPFFNWLWLENLETSGSVSTTTGWQPLYFIAYFDNELCGIAPLFLKNHSYGEFIFDQSFARLALDLNLEYYPKLIGMSPYSPVEGYQFIYKENINKLKTTNFLINRIEHFANKNNILSCNFLYVNEKWSAYLTKLGYHDWINTRSEWVNSGEKEFSDFLSKFNSNQRRNIKRERKSLIQKEINIKIYSGNELNKEIINDMHDFYKNHCSKWGIWGSKYLTPSFFENLLQKKENIIIFSAFKESSNNSLAMSMCVKNKDNLWGRYWGCLEEIENLHFELCYYQPIEWAIKNKIKYFDPGAGGTHKRRRGFFAKQTKSLHKWFNPNMETIIGDWLKETNRQKIDEIKFENQTVPFKF